MMRIERVEMSCDLLVVGGGLAGCNAAIRGASLGLDTIIVEKANTKRSGAAATGVCHISTWIPEFHGAKNITSGDIAEAHLDIVKGQAQLDLYKIAYENSFDRILDLEKMGVPVRYDRSFVEFEGGWRLVREFTKYVDTISFDGRDMKRRMTEACDRSGVNTVNRVMITDPIVRDGRIVGAMGIGTRDGKLYLFKAKAVILSTARVTGGRLFTEPGPGAGVMMNLRWPPSATGDGKAFALRAGAEVINLEYTQAMITYKNLVRGSGFPTGVYSPAGRGVNAAGEVVLPAIGMDYFKDTEGGFLGKKVPVKADLIKQLNEGKGPVYGDMTAGTEEEISYSEWTIRNDGLGWALMHIMKQHNLDFRTHLFEANTGEIELGNLAAGGLWVGNNLETPVKGLFAAGDEVGAIPFLCANGALTLGWHSAECAKEYLDKTGASPEFSTNCDEVGQLQSFCTEALGRTDGDRWQDAQIALNSLMSFYCNKQKTESMLYRGLENLDDLKTNMQLKANNPHELHRALEMRNLVIIAECIIQGARERKESRLLGGAIPVHVRMDYSEHDHSWDDHVLSQRLLPDGRLEFSKRRLRNQ